MPCRPAISSHSLGRAWANHNIESKLDEAARYGFDIELFYEDLEYLAKSLPGPILSDKLIQAASIVRSLCDERTISVVCLQPFMHYEGLRDRRRHAEKVEDFKFWMRLAHILRTSIISIPSTCLSAEEVSGDIDLIVEDMCELADLAASQRLEIAYESLAWGTHIDTWEQCWEVVERVNRPNFGICLDTFNMAARVYGDPAAPSRKNQHAEEAMRQSLDRLVTRIDISKIKYVQVVDAEYLAEPLVEGHPFYDSHQPARMSWSRNCRLFYGEQDRGAYLPVKAILEAILVQLGFEGWVSAELFNKSLTDEQSSVPREHAQRAAKSWQHIVADFSLDALPKTAVNSIPAVAAQGSLPRAQL